jgi:hypothetical protein
MVRPFRTKKFGIKLSTRERDCLAIGMPHVQVLVALLIVEIGLSAPTLQRSASAGKAKMPSQR